MSLHANLANLKKKEVALDKKKFTFQASSLASASTPKYLYKSSIETVVALQLAWLLER
jgi:hypothetical protein